MSTESLLVKVPDELANELVAEGLATTPVGRRSGTWQLIATWAAGTGTTISLLQGPQTIGYLARKLRSLFQRDHDKGTPEQAYVEAKGPGGQMRFLVTASTTKEEIEHLLRSTLFPGNSGD
ncbi:MAG: hypothetical protein M3548_23315 [Actinomycetota bacterium]|nr:hypothetical protein [Actinomycetota bacterium]